MVKINKNEADISTLMARSPDIAGNTSTVDTTWMSTAISVNSEAIFTNASAISTLFARGTGSAGSSSTVDTTWISTAISVNSAAIVDLMISNNNNALAIARNYSTVSAMEMDVAVNKNNISTNIIGISNMSVNLSELKRAVSTNTIGISKNIVDIAEQDKIIEKFVATVKTNTEDISNNKVELAKIPTCIEGNDWQTGEACGETTPTKPDPVVPAGPAKKCPNGDQKLRKLPRWGDKEAEINFEWPTQAEFEAWDCSVILNSMELYSTKFEDGFGVGALT